MHTGFSHSEISGSKVVYHLPEAYRKLIRPSSPSAAKASALCSYLLDHITLKKDYIHNPPFKRIMFFSLLFENNLIKFSSIKCSDLRVHIYKI